MGLEGVGWGHISSITSHPDLSAWLVMVSETDPIRGNEILGARGSTVSAQ